MATYHFNPALSVTLAGRYSGKQYSTLDNTDNTPHVLGAFDSFTVLDARLQYQVSEHLSIGIGIDNLGNQKYFLYHRFPQRTYLMDIKLSL